MNQEMILESIGAVGEHLSDKIDSIRMKTMCPEANRYSRAIVTDLWLNLINEGLTKIDLFVLLSIIKVMNSSNKIGSKYLRQLNMERKTLYNTRKRLSSMGCIYEFIDGSIMVNPRLVILTKYKKQCMELQAEWDNAIKEFIQPTTKTLEEE